jgi:hypothetical protein
MVPLKEGDDVAEDLAATRGPPGLNFFEFSSEFRAVRLRKSRKKKLSGVRQI